MIDGMLTNREWAVLIWLAIGLGLAVRSPSIRQSLWGIVVIVATSSLTLFAVGFAAYIALIVFLASLIGAWDASLLKDTIVWFSVAGLALFAKFSRVANGRFFRPKYLIGVPLLIEFGLGQLSFDLLPELGWQLAFIVLVPLSAFVGLRDEFKSVRPVVERILGLVLICYLALNAAQVPSEWDRLARPHLVLAFYLPLWLTFFALLYVYLLGVYSEYELAFLRIDGVTADARSRRRAKVALMLEFKLRVSALPTFRVTRWITELVEAKSLTEGRRVIARYLHELKKRASQAAQEG